MKENYAQNIIFPRLRMLLAALVFLGGLIFILLAGSDVPFGIPPVSEQSPTIQPVRTQLVQYRDHCIYQRDFLGQVEARQVSEAGFEIGGMLKTIFFDEGDSVKKGDVLAQLDIARLEARKIEAEAALLRSKAAATLAASTYKRFSEARQVNAVSAQEKDESREARDITAATVKVVAAQLNRILVDVEKSTLIAPFDGIVIRRMKDQGTVIDAGQAIMDIQKNANYDIRVGVTNEIANQLVIGAVKRVKIAKKEYDATVLAILPLRGLTRTVDIIMELNQHESVIRPGDTVRLPFDYKVDQQGFWLPLTALVEGQRGLWSVYVVTTDGDLAKVDRRAVEVHYNDSTRAFVSGAVKNGARLITEGAAKIVPGQQVRLLESDNGQ